MALPTIILGLGSNRGDRQAHLGAAVRALAPLLANPRSSPVYESRALLPDGAPEGWDMPFLNMAVAGESALAPEDWLLQAKRIEREIGRSDSGRWGPREIDIDILAIGDTVLAGGALHIPHSGLLVRDFALLPLVDLAPGWRYPLPPHAGECAADIARAKGYGPCDTLRLTEVRIVP